MHRPTDIPDLAIVRALTSGGPYAEGDAISVAFTAPKIGRLLAHESPALQDAPPDTAPLLPETISAVVVRPAGPYAVGDILTLSFVDPAIARIHPASTVSMSTARVEAAVGDASRFSSRAPLPPNEHRRTLDTSVPAAGVPEAVAPNIAASPVVEEQPEPQTFSSGESETLLRFGIGTVGSQYGVEAPSAATPATAAATTGVRLKLSWSDERTRRFVQVTDKLFTVDRLGWYRHAFAMRLLVPDEISCGDPAADAEASLHLRALRSAALETLGRPLIAAFMPTFTVTPEWLDTLDSTEAARALQGLRSSIAPFATNDASCAAFGDSTFTHGIVLERELKAAPQTSAEAMLPLFIANVCEFDDVTERLTSYRQALIELFGGTARSAETVRLTQMAQPNHTLDDRLWQLVGVVSERFGGLAVV